MSIIVSYVYWLSITVSPSTFEFLHVSHYLLCFLAVSHCLYGHMEMLHVSHSLL